MDGQRLRNRLKVHRANLDLTQEQLANLIGCTRKTINTVEKGKYVPSTVLALKMARALQTTVEELFQLPDVENSQSSLFLAPRPPIDR